MRKHRAISYPSFVSYNSATMWPGMIIKLVFLLFLRSFNRCYSFYEFEIENLNYFLQLYSRCQKA